MVGFQQGFGEPGYAIFVANICEYLQWVFVGLDYGVGTGDISVNRMDKDPTLTKLAFWERRKMGNKQLRNK